MALLVSVPVGTVPPSVVPWSSGNLDIIKAMLAANEAGKINIADYWTIGDTREVYFANTVVGNSYALWVITDMNGHTSGGTAYNAIIHTKNCFATSRYMNSSNTNAGGWNACYGRNTVMAEIYAGIVANFKSMIKTVDNVSGVGSQSNTIQHTNDQIWMFTEQEVQGSRTYAGSAEAATCKHFDYFKIASNKVKTGNGGSYPGYWWLRSPRISSSADFCVVSPGGTAGNAGASDLFGVVSAAAI